MIEEMVVETCHDLVAGDEITARRKGYVVHRGRVTETVPEHGLFWIMDELIGGWRLLDMADLEIVRGRGIGKYIADGSIYRTATKDFRLSHLEENSASTRTAWDERAN